MRYSLLAGGKRLRPLLVYLTGEIFDADKSTCDRAAVAIEYIHTYSLIHDDLPAMDDDDLRRGKPSCHKAFTEATAILAGDALQALAFEVLAAPTPQYDATIQNQMIYTLAKAINSTGMAGGQAMDLEAERQAVTLETVKQIHRQKSAALISASITLGALAGKAQQEHTLALGEFGMEIGLAFQIQDDILDLTADTKTLGKPSQSDVAANKATYPSVCGLEQAMLWRDHHFHAACKQLEKLGTLNTEKLHQLAHYLTYRDH
jgi:farnesyl diphosphate synthase